MFTQIDLVIRQFEEQFEPDGMGYVYRRRQKGAAYQISASEHEDFTASFKKQYSLWTWGSLIVASAVMMLAATELKPASSSEVTILILGVSAVWSVFFILVNYRMWNAPERAFAHRTPVAPPLSAEAARRNALKRVTWGELAIVAVVSPCISFIYFSPAELLMSENRLWLGLVLALVGFVAFQAYRKLRVESEPDDEGNQPPA